MGASYFVAAACAGTAHAKGLADIIEQDMQRHRLKAPKLPEIRHDCFGCGAPLSSYVCSYCKRTNSPFKKDA